MGLTALMGGLQSGSSSGGSNNTSTGSNQSTTYSFGNTYGREASETSQQSAAAANEMQLQMMREAMEYNSKEAQKQRDWQTEMANTVYTRSIKNMIEAGINPILAASMGLSGANVGSGSTANISTPNAFMGQTFAEQTSASQGQSYGETFSQGSSWESSRYGVAEGLEQMAGLITDTINNLNTAYNLEDKINDLGEKASNKLNEYKDNIKDSADSITSSLLGGLKDALGGIHIKGTEGKNPGGGGGGHSF